MRCSCAPCGAVRACASSCWKPSPAAFRWSRRGLAQRVWPGSTGSSVCWRTSRKRSRKRCCRFSTIRRWLRRWPRARVPRSWQTGTWPPSPRGWWRVIGTPCKKRTLLRLCRQVLLEPLHHALGSMVQFVRTEILGPFEGRPQHLAGLYVHQEDGPAAPARDTHAAGFVGLVDGIRQKRGSGLARGRTRLFCLFLSGGLFFFGCLFGFRIGRRRIQVFQLVLQRRAHLVGEDGVCLGRIGDHLQHMHAREPVGDELVEPAAHG